MGGAVRAFVGVGANLGDAVSTVRGALQALATLPQTQRVACSSLYRSAPVDASGPDFINAVAELYFGRVRTARNAARTLDLDLLSHGDKVVQGVELTLPHPRAHLRAFVLLPLAEIDPTLGWPGLGPIAPWLERAADQRIERIAA
jgi:2-amino-4-hydroxy-6-hydroxymethyldihydropteridine diphosphokinase